MDQINLTEVTKGKAARKKIKKGVDIIADAVKVTLGARGRNVVIENGVMPHVTKDGVTVANSIFLDDPLENIGAQMIRQAANRTVIQAGDGTTTSTVLAQAMVKLGMEYIESGENPVQIQRDMMETIEEIVEIIQIHSIPITDDKVRDIALISANGDETVGNAIADAFLSVGEDGVISPTESKTHETFVEVVEGMHIMKGYAHGDFITDKSRSVVKYENPNILVADQVIDSFESIIPALEQNGNSPLVIIARRVEGSAFAGLSENFQNGKIKVLPIHAPGMGEHQKEILQDLAIATGSTLISPKTGVGLNMVTPEHFGSAKEIKSSYKTTTIISSGGDPEEIQKRIDGLKVLAEESTEDYTREGFEDRLGRLKGKIAILHVGGSSSMELKEKADRVDDALGATQAAMAEGIVPGGGVMLNYISNLFDSNCKPGKSIVYKACRQPLIEILKNGGITEFEIDISKCKYGIDVKSGETVDMVEKGIIDPAKVVVCCIRNATSVAGMILTTECAINNIRKND